MFFFSFAQDLRKPERGYINADGSVTLRATVIVVDGGDPEAWKDLSTYDSKTKTGMVGLQNQGMTCYMNSVLQTLYHTQALRRGVYTMPTQNEQEAETSVALGIQRVFHRLQHDHDAASTTELTTSFGWTSANAFEQHDVQEFLRVLIDKMEEKMKGTAQEKLLQVPLVTMPLVTMAGTAHEKLLLADHTFYIKTAC